MIRDNIPTSKGPHGTIPEKIKPPPKPLPERGEGPATAQGLFRKYIIRRADGQDFQVTHKHFNCEYFVLDITHDPAAKAALKAYADAVDETYPLLARDIRKKYLEPSK